MNQGKTSWRGQLFEPHIFDKGWDCWSCLEGELSTENGGGGPTQLTMGRLNAKHLQSSGWRGMEKKQSFKSMTYLTCSLGMATGEGSPGCRAPMGTMVILTALRSCNNAPLIQSRGIQLFVGVRGTANLEENGIGRGRKAEDQIKCTSQGLRLLGF